MANGLQTRFTRITTIGKQGLYRFRLVDNDGGTLRSFRVVKHGQAVEFNGEWTVNWAPEDLVKEWPSRVTITPTPHGSWTDRFGLDLPKWTLRGTTGWSARRDPDMKGAQPWTDGYLAYHTFEAIIEEYLSENRRRTIEAAKTGTIRPLLVLEFRDEWDDESWRIEPEGMPVKHRSKDHLPIIRWEFKFTGVANLKDKSITGRIDPMVTALTDWRFRTRKLSESINILRDTLNKTITDVQAEERKSPGAFSAILVSYQSSMSVLTSEPVDGVLARESLMARSKDIGHTVANVESSANAAGGVSSGMQAALDTAKQASADMAKEAMAGSRALLGTCVTAWGTALDSIATAPNLTAGDGVILSTFTSAFTSAQKAAANTSISSLLAAATPDLSNVPIIGSISGSVSAALAPLAPIETEILDVANGTKGFIETGIGKVRGWVKSSRQQAAAIQAVVDQLRVFSSAWRLLRRLRQDLIQLQCAIQSILAFPYLFVKDLMRGLQGLLDLFKLSGCATSFPSIRDLSWAPNIQAPKVVLPT